VAVTFGFEDCVSVCWVAALDEVPALFEDAALLEGEFWEVAGAALVGDTEVGSGVVELQPPIITVKFPVPEPG